MGVVVQVRSFEQLRDVDPVLKRIDEVVVRAAAEEKLHEQV